jgi:nucleoside-diphosphate-sugar epimerase
MKSLLFTGSNGFVGRNIIPYLSMVYKISTMDKTSPSEYKVDLSEEVPRFNQRFDIVLHSAGKAHSIPHSKVEIQEFFDANFEGTKNLCMGIESSGLPHAFIYISTVAVYGCEFGDNITEEQPLNGVTPYALSKKEAEQYLVEWSRKNNIILSILRPSLIAGPNPPGNLGAMNKGIKTGRYVNIAGGKARKSILMVQDIANLVPLLENKGGVFNLCDNAHPSFKQLGILIAKQLNKPPPLSVPYPVAKSMAWCGDLIGDRAPINSDKLFKMVYSLTFSSQKAQKILGWKPLNVLENYVI